MSDQFIGRTVVLSLRDGNKVQGLVKAVSDGQLHITNAVFSNGTQVPTMVVHGGNIANLSVLPDQKRNPSQQFQDPAILSAKTATTRRVENDSSDESEVDEDPYTADEFRHKPPRSTASSLSTSTHPPPSSSQPQSRPETPNRKKRGGRSRRAQHQRDVSVDDGTNGGWAGEDLNDIRDVEFDFQANLNLFDKKQVFNEISKGDTLVGQRLVDFNKIDPHTAKYGHREMVLQANNESNSSALSSLSSPQDPIQQLRKGSTSNSSGIQQQFLTAHDSQPCPVASPLQLQEIETTMATLGLSQAITTENAARGIAQLAVKALGGTSRFSRSNHNARPLVVVLVGNNQAGRKALAAARHLANRQVSIIAMKIGVCKFCDEQLNALKASGGIVESRLEDLISTLDKYDAPPELVIDGLQGYQTTVEDLWEEDATTVIGVIDWANHQKAGVISIDVPCGIDPSTGLPSQQLSSQSYLHAKWVLSCGLPLTGILNAHLAEIVHKSEWSHYLVDIGIPRSVLQTGALRKFQKIWFGSEWLVELHYDM